MLNIKGIAASAGVAIAKAFKLEHPDYTVKRRDAQDSAAELARLDDALAKSLRSLKRSKSARFKSSARKKQRFLNLTCLF